MHAACIDGNDAVDIFDAIVLSTTYGTSIGDSGYYPDADINGDEVIDILDTILLA